MNTKKKKKLVRYELCLSTVSSFAKASFMTLFNFKTFLRCLRLVELLLSEVLEIKAIAAVTGEYPVRRLAADRVITADVPVARKGRE